MPFYKANVSKLLSKNFSLSFDQNKNTRIKLRDYMLGKIFSQGKYSRV